jgi:uncharacterized protein (DUF1697 family)
MIYLALLRGINVGGKNRVEMARLKKVFEGAGLDDVRTYINSGNVIFSSEPRPDDELAQLLERVIAEEFGFHVPVLLRDLDRMTAVEAALPDAWVTDKEMRCDVIFLWGAIDDASLVEDLPVREGIDEVVYAPGAVIWRVDAENLTRSGRTRMIGGQVYKQTTVRNANTFRKLTALMRESAG